MLDDLIVNVITNIPNFTVALLVLYWNKKTIDSLLETQRWLIQQLLEKRDDSEPPRTPPEEP